MQFPAVHRLSIGVLAAASLLAGRSGWAAGRSWFGTPGSSEPKGGSATAVTVTTGSAEGGPPGAPPQREVTNSLGMRMVWIGPGEVVLPVAHVPRRHAATGQRRVRILRGFYVGACEVTQGQWLRVMGKNPSAFRGATRPVEGVSFYECEEFCRRLSAMEGHSYRLPSEAEWEYAARAGGAVPGEGVAQMAWHQGNSGDATHPVGEGKPNPWGLYDLYGNVSEWCLDASSSFHRREPPADQDPHLDNRSASRIYRGGAFCTPPEELPRFRASWFPSSGLNHRHIGKGGFVGFRVVWEDPRMHEHARLRIDVAPGDASTWISAGVFPRRDLSRFVRVAPPERGDLRCLPGPFTIVASCAGRRGAIVRGTAEAGADKTVSLRLLPASEAPTPGQPFTNTLGQHLRWIPRSPDTGRGFWIGAFEVTQKEWEAVMGENPSRHRGPRLPVHEVCWIDCQEFCWRLSALEGLRYRLPTAEEWSVACEAGTEGPTYGPPDEVAWYKGNSGRCPHEVGTKKPNPWGLYDMLGNVGELTEYPPGHERRKERDRSGGNLHPWLGHQSCSQIIVGGDYWSAPERLRSRPPKTSSRTYTNPDCRSSTFGMRVVLESPEGPRPSGTR